MISVAGSGFAWSQAVTPELQPGGGRRREGSLQLPEVAAGCAQGCRSHVKWCHWASECHHESHWSHICTAGLEHIYQILIFPSGAVKLKGFVLPSVLVCGFPGLCAAPLCAGCAQCCCCCLCWHGQAMAVCGITPKLYPEGTLGWLARSASPHCSARGVLNPPGCSLSFNASF